MRHDAASRFRYAQSYRQLHPEHFNIEEMPVRRRPRGRLRRMLMMAVGAAVCAAAFVLGVR